MINKLVSRTTAVFFLVAASLIFIQCGDRSDNADPAVENDSTTVYLNNQNATYIKEREKLVSNLENLKKDLEGRIENLDTRIKDADEADESWVSMRDELIEDHSEVQIAIENLHNSTQDTWNRRKTETENLYERVSSKLDRWNN